MSMKLDKGRFPSTPLEELPDWYLAHVLGGAAYDCPWDSLTTDEQKAIIDENARRKGGADGAATDAKIEAAVDATVPTTGKGSRKAKAAAEGSVSDAQDIIAAADLEELSVIEKAENAGKNRVGVHAAIDKRRVELTPPPTP